MRLTLLLTSPRVAPGLMSWAAWQAVADASASPSGRLLASDPGLPLARAVVASGHEVDSLTGAPGTAGAAGATGAMLLAAAAEADVVWLASDEEAERLPGELAGALVDPAPGDPDVEVLHASYDVPGARLLDLVTVMDQLRLHCPWDREQTHRSLAGYLVEETYETLEAIETGDLEHLREELGDLLLQVVFHARVAAELAEEDGGFDIDAVAGGIVDKLVHRHPHVFAGLDVADADEVEANWERLKAAEKGRASVLEGVPLALPALALAHKVLGRAGKLGITPPTPPTPPAAPAAPPAAGPGETPTAPLGDRLLALVVEARATGLDPEQELREAVRRLAESVRSAESAHLHA